MDDQTKAVVAQEAQRAAEELGVTDAKPDAPANEPAEPQQPVEAGEVTPQEPAAPEASTPPEPPAPETEEDDEPDIPTFYNPWSQPAAPATPQAAQPPTAAPTAPATVPNLDPQQFTDQYGNVDMAKFTQAMQARDAAMVAQIGQSISGDLTNKITQDVLRQAVEQAARVSSQQVMAAKAEERAWERTFEKYPQVKQNKDLRDQIHKMRLGEVSVTGKNVSPLKMAERYFAQMNLARQEGVKQATTQVTTQAVAHLETADNTASDRGLKTQQDWGKIDSRDRRESTAARESLLKQMIADGKL